MTPFNPREEIEAILHDFGVAESLSETQLSDKLKRRVITADEYDDRLVENYRSHKDEATTALIQLLDRFGEELIAKPWPKHCDKGFENCDQCHNREVLNAKIYEQRNLKAKLLNKEMDI